MVLSRSVDCADTMIVRTKTRQELLYTRSQIAVTAKAFGLDAIDMVSHPIHRHNYAPTLLRTGVCGLQEPRIPQGGMRRRSTSGIHWKSILPSPSDIPPHVLNFITASDPPDSSGHHPRIVPPNRSRHARPPVSRRLTLAKQSTEILRATRILHQMEKAHKEQRGAVGLATADGGSKEMIDAPMIKQVTPPFCPHTQIHHSLSHSGRKHHPPSNGCWSSDPPSRLITRTRTHTLITHKCM